MPTPIVPAQPRLPRPAAQALQTSVDGFVVYIVVHLDTDAPAWARVFDSAAAAWDEIDRTASWLATSEELRKHFGVLPVVIEGQHP